MSFSIAVIVELSVLALLSAMFVMKVSCRSSKRELASKFDIKRRILWKFLIQISCAYIYLGGAYLKVDGIVNHVFISA